MIGVILGKLYLLPLQFPTLRKEGGEETDLHCIVSIIHSQFGYSMLYQRQFICCQEMSYSKVHAKVMQFVIKIMWYGLNSYYSKEFHRCVNTDVFYYQILFTQYNTFLGLKLKMLGVKYFWGEILKCWNSSK
jgi:hypothetical protein